VGLSLDDLSPALRARALAAAGAQPAPVSPKAQGAARQAEAQAATSRSTGRGPGACHACGERFDAFTAFERHHRRPGHGWYVLDLVRTPSS